MQSPGHRDMTPVVDLLREKRGRDRFARAGRRTSTTCRRVTRHVRRARTSRPGLPRHKPDITRKPGSTWSGTIRFPPCTAAFAIIPVSRAAIAPNLTRRSASTRSNVSSAISRSRRIGRSQISAGDREIVRHRRGPVRALGGLSPCASRPRGRNSRRGLAAGRDAAFRHPRVSFAARRC